LNEIAGRELPRMRRTTSLQIIEEQGAGIRDQGLGSSEEGVRNLDHVWKNLET
jgi:hypothetical protein